MISKISLIPNPPDDDGWMEVTRNWMLLVVSEWV